MMLYPRRVYQKLMSFNTFWGRVVEFRKNVVHIEGSKFKVDVPSITRDQKANFLFDRYERPERVALRQYLNRSLPVIEFGGNIGVVSCIVNKRLTRPQNHVVVEANPELIPFLERNRRINNCQFRIDNSAVRYGTSDLTFHINENILASSAQMKRGRSVTVPTVTLGALLDLHGFQTCTLICDIEGGEIDLITYEQDVLKNRVSTIFLEVHPKITGRNAIDCIVDVLSRMKFEICFDRWSNMVFQNQNKIAQDVQLV